METSKDIWNFQSWILAISGVRRKKFRGGVQGRRSGLVGGPGGWAPRTPENFRKFAKNSLRKLQKMLYFRLFCKKISKPRGQFLRVWTKNTIVWEILRNFWWKFNGKIEFFSIFWENLLLKIETSEITSFFYDNFFRFGGGGSNPPTPPPLRTPLGQIN